MTEIAGYTYGSVPPSPVSKEDLDLLKTTLMWTDEDTSALARAGTILEPQIDEILDLWYGYVGANAHLVRYFKGADGSPDANYLERVRARFGQWVIDLTQRDWDSDWLAYQDEIALRHTAQKKNQTDHVDSTEPFIPLRYMVAFIWPITATIKEFLAGDGRDTAEVDAMHQAWFKAVTLSTTLWTRPYSEKLW